jgi:tripartite-type tricarboxylate transporter receptor subunit TctC
MAQKGTPDAVVSKLNAEVNKYLALAATKESWAKQGAEPMIMSPAEFDVYLRKDIKKWADLIQSQNIKIQ